MDKIVDNRSRIEILESRVGELEKLVANAPGPVENPPLPDADDRVNRIIGILMEQFHESMFSDMEKSALKRGVRKAMNEFYQGPKTSADQSARINALLQDKHVLEKKLEELERYTRAIEVAGSAFAIGDPVVKIEGYPFPGEVRGVVRKRDGAIVFVVEATGKEYAGMLHIFNEKQLSDAPEFVELMGA